MTYDANGLERQPFDGRHEPRRSRTHRHIHRHHGPDCSSNPEIGCLCDEEERHYDRLERAEARLHTNAAAEGIRPCRDRAQDEIDREPPERELPGEEP